MRSSALSLVRSQLSPRRGKCTATQPRTWASSAHRSQLRQCEFIPPPAAHLCCAGSRCSWCDRRSVNEWVGCARCSCCDKACECHWLPGAQACRELVEPRSHPVGDQIVSGVQSVVYDCRSPAPQHRRSNLLFACRARSIGAVQLKLLTERSDRPTVCAQRSGCRSEAIRQHHHNGYG